MKIYFTGRHFDVTKPIKDFTKGKLQKVERFMDGIIEAHVILSIEKYRHIAEISLHGRHVNFSGKEETQDMYSSIGVVLEKIEKQAKKHKEKLVGRKRTKQATSKAAVTSSVGTVKMKDRSTRRVLTNSYDVKPMTLEEAIFQLEDSKSEFFVFKDFQSQKVNVLYRKKNGDFGLIDPEM